MDIPQQSVAPLTVERCADARRNLRISMETVRNATTGASGHFSTVSGATDCLEMSGRTPKSVNVNTNRAKCSRRCVRTSLNSQWRH